MRKFVFSLAAAGSALALASPASAQYYPQPQPYGGQQYGANYGYNQNYGGIRALHARINSIQAQVENLRARRILTRSEASDLRQESRGLERRLNDAGRNGLNYREMQSIHYRIARLEQHVRHEATDGNRWARNSYNNGYHGYDRDRDGRDDRYENDHGYDRDD